MQLCLFFSLVFITFYYSSIVTLILTRNVYFYFQWKERATPVQDITHHTSTKDLQCRGFPFLTGQPWTVS